MLSGPPTYFPKLAPLSPLKQSINRHVERANQVVADVTGWWQRVSGSDPAPAPRLPRFEPTPPADLLKATVVRAAAFRNGQALGGISTGTYFLMPRNTFELPVVSIVAPEPSLFGYERGILVAGQTHDRFREETGQQSALGSAPANWRQRGVEIPAHFEYFSDRVTPSRASVAQDIGVRVHGGSNRGAPSKSLRLYARKKYGKATMKHAFFGDKEQKYKRLLLRNAGNDFYHAMMRDGAIQRMMGGLRFDTQAHQPTVVFLNGEYWGLLNLREYHDKHYLARVHGVDEDRLDVMDQEGADEGDEQHWNALMAFVESHSLADARHYARVAGQIDIDGFIDYVIANLYAANADWPQNNIRYWRLRTESPARDAPPGHDGRWRWMMFDMDMGFHTVASNALHRLVRRAYDPERPRTRTSTHVLFRALLRNPQFEEAFVIRFSDLLNTHLHEDRAHAVIAEVRALIESEVPRHQQRWKIPPSVSDWSDRVDFMQRFAKDRSAVQRQQLAQFFGHEGDYRLDVHLSDPAHGGVRVNTLTIDDRTPGPSREAPYPWSGRYIKGLPLELEALPAPCFAFDRWEGLSQAAPRAVLRPRADLAVTAVFRKEC